MTTLRGPGLDEVEGIGSLTLPSLLNEIADRFGDLEALVFDDVVERSTSRFTYEGLRMYATQLALALVHRGVRVGDPVAILMGNRPEAVAALFGITMAGAVAVPLSTFATKPELAFMVGDVEPVLVLTQPELLGRRLGDEVAAAAPGVPVAVLGEPSWWSMFDMGSDVDPLIAELTARFEAVEEQNPAVVIYSSGTTSTPKGMLHCHRAVALSGWVQSQLFRRDTTTRMWTAFPMFWTAGLNSAMAATLAAGGCWVMQETFEPGHALTMLAREQVTEAYLLPHQIGALEEHPDWATTDLSAMTAVYGKSALARHPKVSADPTWRMPVGYGMSETCSFFCAHDWSTPREVAAASMGRLLPGNELRIVDPDTGQVLPAGHDGELAVKGPTLMLHYVGRTPAECFDADGFFHTGDAGFVDDAGFVHWTGRRTEMIKTGGANVSPAEIEVALRACPPVKLARVLGVDDERLGQLVVACIVLKDGEPADEATIRDFLKERVASYKVPKRILFFDDLPMTGSDTKVRDDELRALVAHRSHATEGDPR